MARNKLSKEVELKFSGLEGTSLESVDNKLTSEYLNSISENVNTLTDSWRSNLEVFDENLKDEITGTSIYKFIYIDDSQTSVADKLDEMAKAYPLNNETREKLAANIIAEACFENKPVRCIPDISNPEVASVCKPVAGPRRIKKLSIFDKLLKAFGVKTKNYELNEKLNKMKAAIPDLTDKIVKEFDEKEKKREEDAIPAEERERRAAKEKELEEARKKELQEKSDTIADNNEFIPGIVEKLARVSKQRNEHMKALTMQSLANLPDDSFRARHQGEQLTKEQLRLPVNLIGTNNFMVRAYPTLIMCLMLRDNHSLENIFDPAYNPQAKAEAGVEAAKLIAACENKESKAKSMLANDKINQIYTIGGKKLLEEKMPSKEELDGFLDTNKAGYLSAIPYFTFDITQELYRMDPNYLKKPENVAFYAKLDAVSNTAGFCAMREIISHPVSEVPNNGDEYFKKNIIEENGRNAMNVISLLNCENELGFKPADTIGEYVLKNGNKATQLEEYHNGMCTYFANNHGNESEKPLKFRDLYSNKISAIEADKDNPLLIAFKEGCAETRKEYGGDIDKVEARAKLASNIASKMVNDDGKEFSQKQKDLIAVNLMKHDAFIAKTNVAPEEINSLIDKQEFYTEFINQFKKEEKEKVKPKEEIAVENLDKAKEEAKKEKGIGM